MFFSAPKCETAQQRIERIFGDRLNIAAGHSYIEPIDRGTLDPPGAFVKYQQVSGAANSYFQPEGQLGIIEYGLSDNGTDQVIWTLNQTAFPAYNFSIPYEPVKKTKFTAHVQPVAIVGGGIIGAIIGQNVALDEYDRHAFFRIQNTNGGSLFAVQGNDQDVSVERQMLAGIANVGLKLELTVNADGTNSFKGTNIVTGAASEWNPGTMYTTFDIMNLVFAAEGGGPQKYRVYNWRLDYD